MRSMSKPTTTLDRVSGAKTGLSAPVPIEPGGCENTERPAPPNDCTPRFWRAWSSLKYEKLYGFDGSAWHSLGCHEMNADVASSLPTMRRGSAPIAHWLS